MAYIEYSVNDDEIQNATKKVDEIVSEITNKQGELIPAYTSLETAISQLEESGTPIETLLTTEDETGMGFISFKIRTGEGFWTEYSKAIRNNLCDPDGQLKKLVTLGLASSSSHVITAIMNALALPVKAISIVVPIAAILLSIGLDTYCKESQNDEGCQ